ncbi:MAG: hypothetical protein A2Y62_07840 [Candidatus Fischerbacteria bacterium RBG_13_37_8]|uniref:GTP-binding protein n=1 Tax=Candidatus Fischerbacteria bacterium RBG_13_37_8 TaxID=1817863 RepID=A0A1F5V944_9BACT|nr:MAG: hypothetical protein A2Y62_07840 [Candidatus Fischerbacteria bacterium RBG_13_37_8]
MAKTKTPPHDKLICGILYNIDTIHDLGLQKLQSAFGEIDAHLEPHIPFTFTTYYDSQMGGNLIRCFVSFTELVAPSRLAEIKITTNSLEKEINNSFSKENTTANEQQLRLINLDPGLLNPSRLILASAKNYAHRIYLNNGIYAELELLFEKKGAIVLPWTYPDYKTIEYQEFFLTVRKNLLMQLKETRL